MEEDLERLAIHKATYAGFRWADMDEDARERYRHYAKTDIEQRKINKRDDQPPRLKPILFI